MRDTEAHRDEIADVQRAARKAARRSALEQSRSCLQTLAQASARSAVRRVEHIKAEAQQAIRRFLGKAPIGYRHLLREMGIIAISRAEQRQDTEDQLALIRYFEPYLNKECYSHLLVSQVPYEDWTNYNYRAELIWDMLWASIDEGYEPTRRRFRSMFSPKMFNRPELAKLKKLYDSIGIVQTHRSLLFILPWQCPDTGCPLIVQWWWHGGWYMSLSRIASFSGLRCYGFKEHADDEDDEELIYVTPRPKASELTYHPAGPAEIGLNFEVLRSFSPLRALLLLLPELKILLNVECRRFADVVSAHVLDRDPDAHGPAPHWQDCRSQVRTYRGQLKWIYDIWRLLEELRSLIGNIVPAFKPDDLDVKFLVREISKDKVGGDNKNFASSFESDDLVECLMQEAERRRVTRRATSRARIMVFSEMAQKFLDENGKLIEDAMPPLLEWWRNQLEIGKFTEANSELITSGWSEERAGYDSPEAAELALRQRDYVPTSSKLKEARELWHAHLASKSQASGSLTDLSSVLRAARKWDVGLRSPLLPHRILAQYALRDENKQVTRSGKIAALEVDALVFAFESPLITPADAWPTLFELFISPIPPEDLPIQGLLGLVHPRNRENPWRFPVLSEFQVGSLSSRKRHLHDDSDAADDDGSASGSRAALGAVVEGYSDADGGDAADHAGSKRLCLAAAAAEGAAGSGSSAGSGAAGTACSGASLGAAFRDYREDEAGGAAGASARNPSDDEERLDAPSGQGASGVAGALPATAAFPAPAGLTVPALAIAALAVLPGSNALIVPALLPAALMAPGALPGLTVFPALALAGVLAATCLTAQLLNAPSLLGPPAPPAPKGFEMTTASSLPTNANSSPSSTQLTSLLHAATRGVAAVGQAAHFWLYHARLEIAQERQAERFNSVGPTSAWEVLQAEQQADHILELKAGMFKSAAYLAAVVWPWHMAPVAVSAGISVGACMLREDFVSCMPAELMNFAVQHGLIMAASAALQAASVPLVVSVPLVILGGGLVVGYSVWQHYERYSAEWEAREAERYEKLVEESVINESVAVAGDSSQIVWMDDALA